MTSLLIVGLGNNAPRYMGTRHNVGFAVVDEALAAAEHGRANFSPHKKSGTEIAPAVLAGVHVILVKPRCLMNNSGTPVQSLARFYRVPAPHILVIHDDLDLDFGVLQLQVGGGDHGHNGLRSLSRSLGTKHYTRLRVGIGRPPGRMDPARFVLGSFNRTERTHLPVMYADAVDILTETLRSGWPNR